MKLLNIFKKKKTKEKKEGKEVKVVKKPIKQIKPSERPKEVISEAKPAKIKEKRIDLAWKVLKSPHITEKATDLTGKNQYTFKVWPRTNKVEIKKAIEDLYGVDVLGIKIINIPSKRRKLGRTLGERKGYKKAIVKLKKGQKIEVLPR